MQKPNCQEGRSLLKDIATFSSELYILCARLQFFIHSCCSTLLQTTARSTEKMSVGFQPLRTPTMLGGAPAALVSYCQRHGRAAMCFAAAEPPGRRALPQQLLQQQVGGQTAGGGGKSLLLAERHLSCTRQALGVVAAEAMVTRPGDDDAGGGVRGIEALIDSATSSLYV